MKEYQLQKAVCQYLDLNNVLYCGSMGGQYQKYHSQRNKAKATGYKRGFPDLFIYEISRIDDKLYCGLAIELKVKYNKPTNEQRWWIYQLKDRGYKAHICTGIDEAIQIIDDYLIGIIN
mgnify:FL=1|jgi:hypothetical protein|tara:strand:- start:325 stop:681 length:357 start_codon:yes stop_codon:yes gene_type:complete